MSKIYIVKGTTGEYSDRAEWDVKAFEKEETAQTFCAELNALAEVHTEREHNSFASKRYVTWESMRVVAEALEPLDPKARCDYTGLTYAVEELEYVT